jgi:sulfide:quinone oxidoreductase
MKTRSADLSAAVSVFKLSSDANGMTRKKLSPEITASPQVSIADLSRLKSEGFRSIICNRPDGEGPGQTKFADIAQAAKELGLQAWHQPIEPGKVTAADAEAFERKMGELPKPIFAYCRTGMRSTNLWKLSHPGQSTLEP